MIKAIAVDDEPLALIVLETYCKRNNEVELIKTFSNLKDAQKYINQFPIDLMFLDIQVSRTNGMEFYKKLENKIPVIFTTAFEEYAVDGFNVSALDYLLKPIEYERFEEGICKAKNSLGNNKVKNENDFLSIRADYKLNKIYYDEIEYIEGLDDYVKIHLSDNKKITARMSMKSLLEKLPDNLFIRVHRSFIIPTKRIKSVQNKSIFLENKEIPIGDTYKSLVSDIFKN
ncbi:LytTR family DNA-binding domain-containing protein [Chishuiella sp.]|uniref:LytR/AlgR family response regulator transcription factor n=1 Tax=Chishuiella sp. TaxID=1969467 RepID=UPI0028A6D86F|nr:LytTR family DNA-binding domain-containing protein [Chishuiella sp.]